MFRPVFLLILSAALLLGGCKSHNRRLHPLKLGPVFSSSHSPSKTDHRQIRNRAYDPFFDRSRHPVVARQQRGFPHADTTVWTDRSRDHFSYADIYANTGMRYRLDTGDVVRVDVFDQDSLSRLYRVDGGGFISVPLIGAVKARGLSTHALARLIARKLARSYVRDPKVTVEISTHRPFFILGEVRNSGKYPFVVGMTVETAVAIAGGYTPRANQDKVMVIRRLGGKLVRTYVPNNYQIKPGDTLKVVERLF